MESKISQNILLHLPVKSQKQCQCLTMFNGVKKSRTVGLWGKRFRKWLFDTASPLIADLMQRGMGPNRKNNMEADYLVDRLGVNAMNIASLELTTPCRMEQEAPGRLGNIFIPCGIFPSESLMVTI